MGCSRRIPSCYGLKPITTPSNPIPACSRRSSYPVSIQSSLPINAREPGDGLAQSPCRDTRELRHGHGGDTSDRPARWSCDPTSIPPNLHSSSSGCVQPPILQTSPSSLSRSPPHQLLCRLCRTSPQTAQTSSACCLDTLRCLSELPPK